MLALWRGCRADFGAAEGMGAWLIIGAAWLKKSSWKMGNGSSAGGCGSLAMVGRALNAQRRVGLVRGWVSWCYPLAAERILGLRPTHNRARGCLLKLSSRYSVSLLRPRLAWVRGLKAVKAVSDLHRGAQG